MLVFEPEVNVHLPMVAPTLALAEARPVPIDRTEVG